MSRHGTVSDLGNMPLTALLYEADNLDPDLDQKDVDIDALQSDVSTHLANVSNPHSTTKTQVGLSNVDNTSDVNKPVSTSVSTALSAKEGTVTAATSADYYRGDKTFQTLNKTVIGLSNVDNTADTAKPVSTAAQTALNAKANTSSLTTVATSGAYNDLSGKPTLKRIETYLGTTNASGVYTVTYAIPFASIPDVQPKLQAGTDTQFARITASSTTGFSILIRNRTDALGLLPAFSNVVSASVGVLVTER